MALLDHYLSVFPGAGQVAINLAVTLLILIAGWVASSLAGRDGTVDEVGLFMTRLIQFDGVHLLLPNSLIWGNPLINYSRNATRRLDIAVGVRYGDDLDLAMSTLHALIDGYPDVLADPAPSVMASEYRDSAVMLNLRLWTPADQYWNVRFGLYRDAVKALQQAGLKTPIPLREVQSAQPEPAVNGD